MESYPQGENTLMKRELDSQPPEINWLGRLDKGKDDAPTWRGKISANLAIIKERFNFSDERAAREKLDDLKQKINNFYVIAGINAVVRCIDGRGEEGQALDSSNLGPQVPGGTPITSIGFRFSKGLTTNATIEQDFVDYRELVESLGLPYISGAHEDERNSSHPENTGCGAIDKTLEILRIMREYDVDDAGNRQYRVFEYAKAIASVYMNEDDFESAFADVQVKLQALMGPHFYDHYFQKSDDGSHKFRTGLVNKVKEGGRQVGKKTVEKLAGEHNEVFLMVNRRMGETFDRDVFANEEKGQAQAFNYDVWVIVQRARDVFPNDEEKQRTMIVTNMMYAVGTAMALTDGSLELGVRD